MAEEELVDFGFSAVTADEYDRDNTDGENTGSGGSASPNALASMDAKIEQIMAAISSKPDAPADEFGFSQEDKDKQDETLAGIELKIDKILSLEQDEERAQTTADILAQLNDATGESRTSSAKATEAVGKQDEIMKFLESMSPKIDKILNTLLFTFIIKIIFFVFIFLINPLEDPFYQNYLFRYRDGTSYVAALFLLISIFKKNTFLEHISKSYFYWLIILSVFLVIITNLRILLPAILFAYLFIFQTSSKNLILKAVCTFLYIGSFMGYSYLLPKIQYNLHGKEKIELRIKNLEDRKLSKNRIEKEKKILKKGYQPKRYNSLFNKINQQLETRFSPAMKYLNNLNAKKIVIGKGIGTTFKIQSFSYRGLDLNLNKIDSFYLTQFIKYGIFGLILILILFKIFISKNIFNNRLKLSIISFYLIIMLVNSVLYQPGTIVHLTLLNLIMISINQKNIIYKETTVE